MANFHLDAAASDQLTAYLRTQNWLVPDEPITQLEKPGEGNMNYVLRVRTPQRSFIVKQARPYVEKYPQIAAPVERSAVEAAFYRVVTNEPQLAKRSPQLLGCDPTNHVLVLEDLGAGSDFTHLYQRGRTWDTTTADALIDYLSALHALSPTSFPDNLAMRRLNHEHLFVYPLATDTGFNLDTVLPGLAAVAQPYQQNAKLKSTFLQIGKLYLSKGNHLLHGDFYPASWLATDESLYVIDPEFAFVGPAEYDLGIYYAHLLFARHGSSALDHLLDRYAHTARIDHSLLLQFTGVELTRRLIGLAQLPIDLDLEERQALLERGVSLVLENV